MDGVKIHIYGMKAKEQAEQSTIEYLRKKGRTEKCKKEKEGPITYWIRSERASGIGDF